MRNFLALRLRHFSVLARLTEASLESTCSSNMASPVLMLRGGAYAATYQALSNALVSSLGLCLRLMLD